MENENIKKIIKQCINFDPKKRPTIEKLMSLNFFNNNQDNSQVFSKTASEIEADKKNIILE